MTEYGIFNDEASEYTEAEAVETGFYSIAEAEETIADRYHDDDSLFAHEIEEPEEGDENEEESDDEDEDK